MALSIKRCDINDLDQLVEIAIETFVDTFLPNNKQRDIDQYVINAFRSSKLMDELHNPESQFFFIYSDGELAGYLKVNVGSAQTEAMGADSFEVQRIYVRPKFKGQGVGTELMNRAILLAKRAQKRQMWLGVWEKNVNAQRFYQKFGFTKTGSHQFLMGSTPNHDWIMSKQLIDQN